MLLFTYCLLCRTKMFSLGLIKTTNHRPTGPPTTYYLPSDPLAIYPPTAYHQLTLKQTRFCILKFSKTFVIIYFLNKQIYFNAILYIDLIFGSGIRIQLRVGSLYFSATALCLAPSSGPGPGPGPRPWPLICIYQL